MLYAPRPSAALRELLQGRVSWSDLVTVRGWCRLRAQVVPLMELAGRPSRAQEAYCVFCAALVRAPVHHVLEMGTAPGGRGTAAKS